MLEAIKKMNLQQGEIFERMQASQYDISEYIKSWNAQVQQQMNQALGNGPMNMQ